MYPLNEGKEATLFQEAGVFTSMHEIAERSWDQVWLCISTPALEGEWLPQLLENIGDATLVSLQPGIHTRDWLAQRYPAEKTVFGVITFISWPAPLPGGEAIKPGIAYWLPPLSPNPFSGSSDAVSDIVRTLRAGGCPAKAHRDAAAWAATPTAILMPHLCALEMEGWSLRALRKSPHLETAAAASREALSIVGSYQNKKPPWQRYWIRRGLMRIVLWFAPKLTPFDLETYLQVHFTKVGGQTRFLINGFIRSGAETNLPTDHLKRLSQTLP